jgi:hypothetical protein
MERDGNEISFPERRVVREAQLEGIHYRGPEWILAAE